MAIVTAILDSSPFSAPHRESGGSAVKLPRPSAGLPCRASQARTRVAWWSMWAAGGHAFSLRPVSSTPRRALRPPRRPAHRPGAGHAARALTSGILTHFLAEPPCHPDSRPCDNRPLRAPEDTPGDGLGGVWTESLGGGEAGGDRRG